MKSKSEGTQTIEKGIHEIDGSKSTIKTGGTSMKEESYAAIENDRGRKIIEVVRSAFSEKDLARVIQIDPFKLKYTLPPRYDNVMGSQDLNISCDVEQNLLSFKLDFSNPIPQKHIESTLRILNLANTESCSYRYMCNPDSGKVSLRLDHPITHPSLQKSIAKRILTCMYTDSIHMALMLHWLLTQGREPTELYTRYRFALENTHNKIRSTPDLGTVTGSYSTWDVYDEIGSAMERLYNAEPIAKHLKCGKLLYDFHEIEKCPMRCRQYYWNNYKATTEWHLPELCTAFGGMSTMIQIAATWLDYDEIYLLGCDLGYTPHQELNHAVPVYTKDKRDKSEQDNGNMLHLHKMAKKCSPVPIYNATVGGELEVYERRDIWEVLSQPTRVAVP